MGSSWPSDDEVIFNLIVNLDRVRKIVAEMSGGELRNVKVIVSPYRICPLGAHIDHQGGTVLAMTINKGILLAFIPSGDSQVLLRSEQFCEEKQFSPLMQLFMVAIFSVDEIQYPRGHENHKDHGWGNYARGALFALQKKEHIAKGIVGYICGTEGLDSSGLSSSAAVGIAYLLALQSANGLAISPAENIELDRIIENEYLGLKNGILDQSAILLSSRGCLTCMNCKAKEHMLVRPINLYKDQEPEGDEAYKILLAFSGVKEALTNNPGYNCRVCECKKAAADLLLASGKESLDPLLCDVEPDAYEAHKEKLENNLRKRAEHYFSENMRVNEGLKAWSSGKTEDFGKLISASGRSSIENYECGCEPLIQLYEILVRTPGVFGARFSGAGFRGCCLAFVDPKRAVEVASSVRQEYLKVQPKLARQLSPNMDVLICESGDSAHII